MTLVQAKNAFQIIPTIIAPVLVVHILDVQRLIVPDYSSYCCSGLSCSGTKCSDPKCSGNNSQMFRINPANIVLVLFVQGLNVLAIHVRVLAVQGLNLQDLQDYSS